MLSTSMLSTSMLSMRGQANGHAQPYQKATRNRLIELCGVTKTYRRRARNRISALASFDLRIEAGSTVAVVGPNGAGKSTLFGVLAGLIRPDRGRAFVHGLSPAAYVRSRGIGLLPDRVRLPARLTVRETLERLAILDGHCGTGISRSVDRALDLVGLSDRGVDRCGGLSHGLRQRVGIAQLLLRPREVLLLDEPLSGLDPVWRACFRELFEQLHRDSSGRTLLLSSHELGETARLTERVIVIEAGRVVDDFPTRGDSEALEHRVLSVLLSATGS
jgi:ABC-2 type transport system ATP-binding protein